FRSRLLPVGAGAVSTRLGVHGGCADEQHEAEKTASQHPLRPPRRRVVVASPRRATVVLCSSQSVHRPKRRARRLMFRVATGASAACASVISYGADLPRSTRSCVRCEGRARG